MFLITGGSGFIGSHFHEYLPQEKIINLDLVEPFFDHKATFIKGDIRLKEDVRKAIGAKKIDAIISLAAKHHDFGIGHEEYFDTNEQGTGVLCEAATEFGIKTIIFYSSVAVYGLRDNVSSESMEPSPDSSYGASKLAGEKVLEAWAAQDRSRRVLFIRPTIVFGRNNKANMYNLIRQIDSGFYFHLGKANNIKSIAYVENLIQATLYLMENVQPGVSIFNYADEPQLTTRQISDTIAKALNKKISLTMPRQLALLIGLPFDLVIKLTGKNLPVSTKRIMKLSTQTYHSAQKLFSEGFSPRFSTVDGIKKMVAWYQAEKNKV